MVPEGHLEVWQRRLQKSNYGGKQEELAETAPGRGSFDGGGGGWLRRRGRMGGGREGEPGMRLRTPDGKHGWSSHQPEKPCLWGNEPRCGAMTKDAPWAVRAMPRLHGGAESLRAVARREV